MKTPDNSKLHLKPLVSIAGVYYHRPAAPASEGKWVIRFMGGGWCVDGPTCAARAAGAPYWVSSRLCRVGSWHVPKHGG